MKKLLVCVSLLIALVTPEDAFSMEYEKDFNPKENQDLGLPSKIKLREAILQKIEPIDPDNFSAKIENVSFRFYDPAEDKNWLASHLQDETERYGRYSHPVLTKEEFCKVISSCVLSYNTNTNPAARNWALAQFHKDNRTNAVTLYLKELPSTTLMSD